MMQQQKRPSTFSRLINR